MKIIAKGKLLNTIRKYEKLLSEIECDFRGKVGNLETQMQNDTGIKDIEFFISDGDYVGVGTPADPKKMELVHRKYY